MRTQSLLSTGSPFTLVTALSLLVVSGACAVPSGSDDLPKDPETAAVSTKPVDGQPPAPHTPESATEATTPPEPTASAATTPPSHEAPQAATETAPAGADPSAFDGASLQGTVAPLWWAPGYGWGPGVIPPLTPVATPAWAFAGTYAYFGVAQGIAVPLGNSIATHVLVEAPWSCAPRITSATATTFGGVLPMWFQGQRWVGNYAQALLRIGNGFPTTVAGATLTFASAYAVSCPINVYVVRAY